MEPHGTASRADGDFLELEPDEELLCSVSDITEHLGRNITVVLETALSEIRKMVSIRIRVLKMELREKTEEIEVLKSRLGTVQRDGRDPVLSVTNMEPSADAGLKKLDFCSVNKLNSVEPRRAKAVMPGVKKENINAICDYLMKDKNSRGCTEVDGDQSGPASGDREPRQEPDPHSLNLWPDNNMAGTGPGHGDPESTTDDIFSMLPSGSKRMYDYEWIAPMEYSSDLKVMKEPECVNTSTSDSEDEDEDESVRKEEGGLEQAQEPLSHVQPSEFSMEHQSSPGEGGSPLEGNTDRPAAAVQLEILEKGLTFIPTPCPLTRPELRGDLRTFHRRLKLLDYFHGMQGREPVPFTGPSHWQPHTNTISPTTAQLVHTDNQALTHWQPCPHRASNIRQEHKQIIKTLSNCKHIVIKPADKETITY